MGNDCDSNPAHNDSAVLSSSFEVKPDLMGNTHLERRLQENFILKQTVNNWKGPKHPEYCDLIDRVNSFKHVVWPETGPTPASLAEAGFFFEGELTNFQTVSLANYM
jgi:hypothetical protein